MTIMSRESTPLLKSFQSAMPAPVLSGQAPARAARLQPHGRTWAACACAFAAFLLLAVTGFAVFCATLPHGSVFDPAHAAALWVCLAAGVLTLVTLLALDGYATHQLAAPAPLHVATLISGSVGGVCCLAALCIARADGALDAALPLMLGLALVWIVMAFLGLTVGRAIVAIAMRAMFGRGALMFRVAVFGATPEAEDLRHTLRKQAHLGIAVCGPEDMALAVERCGSFSRFCHDERIDAVVVDGPAQAMALADLGHIGAEMLCPLAACEEAQALRRHPLEGLPVTLLQGRPLRESGIIIKGVFDALVSAAILASILPALAVVAAAIKLDSRGPVLFRQPRIGYGNETFQVLKFRTMYQDKTDMLAARQTERGDPRVTRVGRVLRRLSIDELPQLFNVLAGDMSLVGPRPHAPHTSVDGLLLHSAIAEYGLRHRVKPGITGWAQVNGARGALQTQAQLEKRLQLDLDYIRRWSLGLDLRILVMTICREIFSIHAY